MADSTLEGLLDPSVRAEVTVAPVGQVYVCGGCGRQSRGVLEFRDESCMLNAVLCYEKKGDLGQWVAVR